MGCTRGQDFDEFKESKELDVGNGEKQIFRCLIFTSGKIEYNGVNDVAHFRFDGKFEVVDESHVTFFEILEDKPTEPTTSN